jgi:hypothetical protein
MSPVVQIRTRTLWDNCVAALRQRYLRWQLQDNDRYMHQLERALAAHRQQSERLRCELAHWER